jgi:hypothetical protein
MDRLHTLGVPALSAIERFASDLEQQGNERILAAILIHKIPILSNLNRPAEAQAELNAYIQRFHGSGSAEIQELVSVVRSELDQRAEPGC